MNKELLMSLFGDTNYNKRNNEVKNSHNKTKEYTNKLMNVNVTNSNGNVHITMPYNVIIINN